MVAVRGFAEVSVVAVGADVEDGSDLALDAAADEGRSVAGVAAVFGDDDDVAEESTVTAVAGDVVVLLVGAGHGPLAPVCDVVYCEDAV